MNGPATYLAAAILSFAFLIDSTLKLEKQKTIPEKIFIMAVMTIEAVITATMLDSYLSQ